MNEKINALVLSLTLASAGMTQTPAYPTTLQGHVPMAAIAKSRLVGRVDPDVTVPMVICLSPPDPGALATFIYHAYKPQDPLYGKFLTPDEFTARFSPSTEDYSAAVAYAQSQGFTVTGTHSNRMMVEVQAPAQNVEDAFKVHLLHYRKSNGQAFMAPDTDPTIPNELANSVHAVVGIHTASRWHHHSRSRARTANATERTATTTPPPDGLSPIGIRTAYNLLTSGTGTGQTVGLLLLDDYRPTDISTYASQFGLTPPPITRSLITGAPGVPGSDSDEATLDVELQMALASGVQNMYVYECPNTNDGFLAALNKIATDNLAKSVSTSWGDFETDLDRPFLNSENFAFQQMAAQGQSMFATAGDDGAFDDGTNLSVDDPGSQPFVTSVGGTQLGVKADGTYQSETTWNDGSATAGAGGGGISSVWTIPYYQKPTGIITAATLGSTTMRNVPDVALEAEPETGYAVCLSGVWDVYGGTSTAAPLWAAFGALVNEARAAKGFSPLGFANAAIYTVATGTHYSADFHDIADDSTNLKYPAVPGYDDATGWGSMNGANLIADLVNVTESSGQTTTPMALATPTPTPVVTAAAAATPAPAASSSSGGCQARPGGNFTDAFGTQLPFLILMFLLALRRERGGSES